MSNETIVVDKQGDKLFEIVNGGTATNGLVFQASKPRQIWEWLTVNHESFKKDCRFLFQNTSSMGDVRPSAKIEYSREAIEYGERKPFSHVITFAVSLANPPKIRTLADLTIDEKVDAIIKAIGRQGIQLEIN